jgi:ketosteroid isomerase-like protein
MELSAATERQIAEQREGGSGDEAWVLTRSDTTGTFRGRAIRASGVETMVLARRDGEWRIVHIHWSSHSRE